MAQCTGCNGRGGEGERREGGMLGWRICQACGGTGKANEPPPDHISKKKRK